MKSRTVARLGNSDPRLGEKVKVRGRVVPGGSRRLITVAVGGETLKTRTRTNGTFKLRWKPEKAGTETVRVRAAGDKIALGSGRKAGRVTVFRPAGQPPRRRTRAKRRRRKRRARRTRPRRRSRRPPPPPTRIPCFDNPREHHHD